MAWWQHWRQKNYKKQKWCKRINLRPLGATLYWDRICISIDSGEIQDYNNIEE